MNLRKGFLMMALMLSVSVAMVSCGDDDSETGISIVGTWNAVDVTRINCTSADDNSTVTLDCPSFCFVFTYNSDGTASSTYTDPNSGTSTGTGTYTISGNSLTQCESGDCETSTFVLNGSTLVLTSLEEDSGCSVVVTLIKS